VTADICQEVIGKGCVHPWENCLIHQKFPMVSALNFLKLCAEEMALFSKDHELLKFIIDKCERSFSNAN